MESKRHPAGTSLRDEGRLQSGTMRRFEHAFADRVAHGRHP